jgi:CHAD domain-containing protein
MTYDSSDLTQPSLLERLPDTDSLIIASTDPMPEALRRVLLRFFREMLEHEPIARLGEDIEGVHKMRVAIRRQRSVYRIFGDFLPKRYRRGHLDDLRHTARLLGAVRDLDVFMERTRRYIDSHLGGNPDSLTGLVKLNHSEHHAARTQLIHWLDSPDYQSFIQGYAKLLLKPLTVEHLQRKSTSPFPFLVKHSLPQLLYNRYNALRRYETILEVASVPTLHAMRIDAKRFRYALDAFAELMEEPAGQIIGSLKKLQDHLGELNDAAVAINRLGVAYDCVSVEQRAGIVLYQDHFKQILAKHIATTPQAWAAFDTPELRGWLAQGIQLVS